MKNNGSFWAIALILILLVAICVSPFIGHLWSQNSDREFGPNLVFALIGAALSALVTLVLLYRQTKNEQATNTNVEIYKKKLEIYTEFNEILWKTDTDIKALSDKWQNLIFYLPTAKIEQLSDLMKDLDAAEDDSLYEIKSKMSYLLKCDLQGKDYIKSSDITKTIADIAKLYKNVIKPSTDQEATLASEQSVIKWTNFNNELYESIDKTNVTYWHFCAYDATIQDSALSKGNNRLSLMEWGTDKRTNQLRQVQPGDVIFLFNSGGAGYVGMYKAIGKEIITHLKNDNKFKVETYDLNDICSENVLETPAQGADIYGALNEGGDYVASIMVEEVSSLRGKSRNPIGVAYRQTICRINNREYCDTILRYFDGQI
ncbi:MAG: hypothetical protein IK053_07265 [Muribaculaceae bacterium]|nr:hypothetical protein [Muribaculaceae bacterium]